MKKAKVLLLTSTIAAFSAFALGSGSSEKTSRESVTIEADNTTDEDSSDDNSIKEDTTQETNDNNKTEKNSETREMDYEITDTGFEYYTNSIGDVEYYGYVELTNTGGCDIYLNDCTFDLEDNDGHLLQSDSYISHCPEVISPGEKGYFYNGLGSNLIDPGVSLDNGVTLVPQMKLKEATGRPVSFPVSDVDVHEDNIGYLKVTGRVENTTDEDVSLVGVKIIFLDSAGKAIAFNSTTITEIAAGGKASFDVSTMFANDNLKLENIAETKVIAEDMYIQF